MTQERGSAGVSRRSALRAAVGTAAIGGLLIHAERAQAQTTADIDFLNLVLNMEYLLAQFTSAVVRTAVDPARLTGNGVAGTAVIAGKAVTFTDLVLSSIVAEMAADSRNHLLPIRSVIGALAVRQPLIDISAGATAPFAVAMQRAGVVAAGATFDPYASEENMLYALFLLKGISVAAYRGLTASIGNRVVVQNFTGLLGAEAIHSASIRSYIYGRGATLPRMRDNAEKIAAFQRSLNGGAAFRGVGPVDRTYPGGTAGVRTARITPAQADGQAAGLSAGQLLNQLYLSAAAVTAGGFFPEGVNGTIRTSAAA